MGKQKIKYAYYTQFPNYLSTPLLLFFCFFVCSFSQILYFFCIGLGMVFGFWFSGIVTLNLAYNGYSRLMVMVCAPSSRFLPYASRNAKCKKKNQQQNKCPRNDLLLLHKWTHGVTTACHLLSISPYRSILHRSLFAQAFSTSLLFSGRTSHLLLLFPNVFSFSVGEFTVMTVE